MPKPATLSVVVNPYTALDADGDPAGYVLRVDLRRHSSKPLLLGAERVLVDGAIKVRHSLDPVTVPDLPAYRRHLRTGELLSADEATARAAGVPWRPVAEALTAARCAAGLPDLAPAGAETPSTSSETP